MLLFELFRSVVKDDGIFRYHTRGLKYFGEQRGAGAGGKLIQVIVFRMLFSSKL